MCTHVAHRGQKRVLSPLELDLQMLVSHHVCVLEIEPRSSEREHPSALN